MASHEKPLDLPSILESGGDVELSIASLLGESAVLTTHKGLTTGVHGVGGDYLAKAAGSQYTAVNRAGDTGLTGTAFRYSGNQDYLDWIGGVSFGGVFRAYGKDHVTYPGGLRGRVPNAAKNAWVDAFVFSGAADTPEMTVGVIPLARLKAGDSDKIDMGEMAEPANPGAGIARIYAVENGDKTDLYVKFQTGAGVLIAAEV